MSDLGLDASQETRITVMQLKIERLEEKQEELRERLKVVEKWVIGAAAVLAAGVTVTNWKNQNANRGGNILVSANRSIHKKMLKLLKPVL